MAKLSQRSWVLITFVGFLLFLVFFYLIITNKQKIELTAPTYFFLIIIVDLVATGFLFGAMKSVATLQSKSMGATLSLAGPAAMFVVILYLGYEYRPITTNSQLALTVFINDVDDGNNTLVPTNASLLTNRTNFDGDINKSGTIRFNGIPSDLKGQHFQLNLAVTGYHQIDSNRFVFNPANDMATIRVGFKKNSFNTSITGQLINPETKKGIAGATVHFDGTGVSIKTDRNGNFDANLPIETGTELRIIAQSDGKEVYSSLRTISQHSYLLLAAD